jgi:hypothetical protein
MTGMLFLLNRLMPERALRLINGFIPANVEELLAEQEKGAA